MSEKMEGRKNEWKEERMNGRMEVQIKYPSLFSNGWDD